MIKKRAKGLPSSFERRKKGFREDGGQKITLSTSGFNWRHKMSIYKLKLGFLPFWGFLIVFRCSMGLWVGPHQNMMFWALKMKF